MDRILRLNEFFVEGGKQHISHVLLHISEPTTPEEIAKGYFFAVCEINNAEPKYFTKIKDLIDRAGNDYYETADANDKNALELVLEKLNQEALTLVDTGLEIHCIIGAIRQPEITFTYYGKPQVLVFYKNHQGVYQSIDLVEANSDNKDAPTQLFSHIIQGKISSNDFLFAGTPHIGEYFSTDRLQKIITSRPAVQSAQHIERVLSEIKNGHSFGGLVIHIDRADSGPIPIRKAPVVKGASSKSLHSLFNREQSTANTLSPSILPRLKTLFGRNSNTPETPVAVATKTYQPAEINASHISHRDTGHAGATKELAFYQLKSVLAALFRAIIFTGKTIALILVVLYGIIYSAFLNSVLLVFAITNYQNRRQHILETWRKQWHSNKENIRRLPTITKVLFFAAILAAGGIAVSIAAIKYRQTQAAHDKQFKTVVQQIKNKKDAMESALIYKDDQAAQTEFVSAEELFGRLECLSKEEKATCAELQNQFDEFDIKIRKITITEPELLFEWKNGIELTNVVKVNTKLISFSANTSTLFIFDLLSREEKIIASGAHLGFVKANVPKENDYALFNTSLNNFFKFDPADSTIKPVNVKFSNEQTSIADFLIYNRRLYTLDTLNNQVYKHDGVKNGFEQGKEWIKDGTLVKDGQELTIDGDMYILKNSGLITKFTAGISQPFSMVSLIQSVGKNASLWTYTDLQYLYILDPDNKRLIILEKGGRIKQQLVSEMITRPTGFAIDPTNNIAYILDNNKLLKIILPQ